MLTTLRMLAGLSVVSLLGACGGGTTVSFRESAVVDGYQVKWSDASALVGKRPDGLSTMMFIITPVQTGAKPAPVAQRPALAQAAMAAGQGKCRWAAFDPAMNQELTQRNGAGGFTLYALARC